MQKTWPLQYDHLLSLWSFKNHLYRDWVVILVVRIYYKCDPSIKLCSYEHRIYKKHSQLLDLKNKRRWKYISNV
jgi:hypothetical protein